MDASDFTSTAAEFLRDYYKEDLAVLAESDERSLYVEYGDLVSFEPGFADDYIEHSKIINQALENAIGEVDLPLPETPNVHVRVRDSRGHIGRKDATDLVQDDLGTYVAVEGQMTKVTGLTYRIVKAVYECNRCGTRATIPQTRSKLQEPHECRGCDRQGIFQFKSKPSTLVDLRKLKLETPPGERAQGQGDSVTVYAEGDLPHIGGEHGLADHAGEQVVVFGRFEDNADQLTSRRPPELQGHIVAEAIEFAEPSLEELSVEETKDEFMALADGDEGDPVDLLKRSIAPRLERTEQLDLVLEAAVAWLFNAYRVEQRGEQIRGDLHMGIIGDPGTAKSTVMASLAKIAPKCVFRSGGGGITKAGLTAAAVQEEFAGQTEWTLEPGILPRGNGGHVIIDEIDEILGEKTKATHDALEGEQLVKVDKAGISADLPTRCAVLIGGNPKDGRFDPYAPIADQLDMDPAFISRIDILLDVTDTADPEHDRGIARTVLESEYELTEAQVAELMGDDVPEADRTKRPVAIEVFRDWVHYARENCFPQTTEESREMIEELYLEVRNLNNAYAGGGGDDQPIPATPRVIESCIRLSKAFARVELSEVVEPRHVDRTRDILKATLKLNFDRETGQFDADKTTEAMPKSQRDRIVTIKEVVQRLNGPSKAALADALVDDVGLSQGTAESEIEKLLTRGELYEPPDGGIRVV